jgi:hypothetical protein
MPRKTVPVRFPTLIVVLLALTFVFGGAAGAFVYASGKAVLETPRMAMVSHTEYAFSAPGQIITRLVNSQGSPVVVDNCTATILYPDKTFFVNAALMTSSVNISGDHYYAFTTPAGPEGTYEYQATCYYGANKNASVTNSFHLTPNFNSILGNLSEIKSNLSTVTSTIEGFDVLLTEINATVYEVNDNVLSLNTTVAGMSSMLDVINATTTNTYTYLTTTLVGKVDTVLADLGVINATVNRIETTTTQINTTVNTILTNQQDEVRMDVFSG